MKKMLTLTLAILLALVTIVPASAQNRGRNGSRDYYGNRGSYGYYGDGYHGTAVERSVHQTQGLVNGIIGELGYGYGNYGYRGSYGNGYGYGYDYGYYPYRGRHDTRNVLIGAAVVGGILAIDKLSHRDNNDGVTVEASKCFERTVKAARKQGVPVDPNQVMAMCSGQPLRQPEPERMSEHATGNVEQDIAPMPAPVPEGFTPAPTTAPHQFRGAYRENGTLCNDSNRTLTVLINGRVVGTVAPGSYITISRLPAGQLSYRYE